ncbi:MFS transporter [Solitalea lacus]|uniref:MFS transporter n=1 Tax=Solitalea lacus TaxID=2911172 RepID=UPI001ED9EA8A|nr:MFS transporter [Solitalea lacus]UKJ07444.1 MFS transporter [Solitalea lacus]
MNQSIVNQYRWRIAGLLFFATTINYLDRQVIGLLKPVLEKEFQWTETNYANIVMAFTAMYAIGLLGFGRLVDKIGSKLGYFISVAAWSIAAIGHAFVKTTFGFGFFRAALGLAEAGNFPAAIKSVTEWFPKKERALATGIFNSGANIGVIVAQAFVPLITFHYGWQQAFVWTGATGIIWLILWWKYYEIPTRHKKISQTEYDYIHCDADLVSETKHDSSASISWFQLLKVRQTWAFVTGKFLTDPIWWFFLFWLPSFFVSKFSLNLKSLGLPGIAVYTAACIGSIGGGWLSGHLIKKGWPVFKARKTAMLSFAFMVVPIFFIQYVNNLWIAVGLISLAAAAHQAWSANIFTTASDMFPKQAISSVVGIGGMAGAVGGILFPLFIGFLLDHYKAIGNVMAGYNIIFSICGSAYLLAWIIMHFLVAKLQPVRFNEDLTPTEIVK